jgi:hypothetical protein
MMQDERHGHSSAVLVRTLVHSRGDPAALREVLGAPELKQRFLDFGVEARASSPEEIGARLRADIEKWSQVIARAGIPRQ